MGCDQKNNAQDYRENPDKSPGERDFIERLTDKAIVRKISLRELGSKMNPAVTSVAVRRI